MVFLQKKWLVILTKGIAWGVLVLAGYSLIKGQWYNAIFWIIVYFIGRKIRAYIIKSDVEVKEKEQAQKVLDIVFPINQPLQREAQQRNEEQARKDLIKQIGEDGEKRVQYGLQMLRDFENYKIYNDFYIVADNGFYQQIDHMALGENGIFHIETKTFKGEYEIKSDGSWYKRYNGVNKPTDTPTSQIERHEMVINSVLKNVLPEGVNIQHILAIGTEDVRDITIWGKDNCKYPIVHHKDISSYIKNKETNRKLTKDEIVKIHQIILSHLKNGKPERKQDA
jgi:hypothetical protein